MKKFLICLIAMALVLCMVLPLASCVADPETPDQSESERKPENEKPGDDEKPGEDESNPVQGGDSDDSDSDDSEESAEEPDFDEPIVNPYGVQLPAVPTDGYVYKDAVTLLSANWNTHTYQTSDESYPVGYLTTGLYGFFFNDGGIYVNDAEPYSGYVIAPEMAAAMPVDVTEAFKALEGNPYGIPSDATKGYAYTIKLNPAATWQNGEKINADTYIYSMKQLLDPDLMNYRGPDYFDGDFAIANAKKYYYQGTTSYNDNGIANQYALADLVKGDDGNYYTADGNAMYIAVDYNVDWFGNYTFKIYVDAYGESYFDVSKWEVLVDAMDEEGKAPLNDETYAALVTTITGNAAWGETEDDAINYLLEKVDYADNYDFNNVGIYKNDEYTITLVLEKSLTGFYLLYNLTGNWLVYEPYYEAGKTQIGDTDAWTNSYCSDVASTMSYGPYKLVEYQAEKQMVFERNNNWFGYTDNKHGFMDQKGVFQSMYQTTKITCQVVEEPDTRKLMFLKGELMGYGLQSEDFAEYRSSDRAYVTPSETIYFLIFNGHMEAIQSRENDESFDKSKNDLETITLNSFRRAFAVTYNKEAFASTISPARSGGYGLIGSAYIYDPETGARYRDTPQAKKALCEFYSVDWTTFAGETDEEKLDAAVDSITGYDPETAKVLFTQAYNEALELGYITDENNDGISDQTIRIEYASSATSEFIQKTLAYLNEKLSEVLVDTPFQGKIEIYESSALGDAWVTNIQQGLSDTVLGGWSGSALNPFSLTDLYTNPNRQYDAEWFNAASVELTLNIAGEDVTLNLKQWSDALNGTVVEKNGKQYNFGDGMVDVDTRLDILAAIETQILSTYDYIPMLQDGSVALLSRQVYYVVEDYNPIMGRGGIAYMRYNYNETDWAAFVASQEGGQVKY